MKKYSLGKNILSAFFALLSLVWLFPIFEVVINSVKENDFVNLEPFAATSGGILPANSGSILRSISNHRPFGAFLSRSPSLL